MTNFEKNHLYTSSEDFFLNGGNNTMKLGSMAAIDVCRKSVSNGFIVSRVEGGIWHNPGFEMRLDCIWDRSSLLENSPDLASEQAVIFIQEESVEHDAFIVSLQKIA